MAGWITTVYFIADGDDGHFTKHHKIWGNDYNGEENVRRHIAEVIDIYKIPLSNVSYVESNPLLKGVKYLVKPAYAFNLVTIAGE